MPKIYIIIPVLNEEKNIENTLTAILRHQDSEVMEIIVVDGGSQDQTVVKSQTMGVKVIISPHTGRATQMNLGAEKATGDILLFLHGDTIIPDNFPKIMTEILAEDAIIAGAFLLQIDSQQLSLKLIEKMANLRAKMLALPYGDQGIFLSKNIFQEMGGFKNMAIMEDFDLIQRLKKRGKIKIASLAVTTSCRRWQNLGVCKTTLINQLVIIGYYCGIKPERLKQFYRREKFKIK
jgi:rSAM/selenodomain-associated transferase 2